MLVKIVLAGCSPEPLSNYLKALGVLRVLTESGTDSGCKGYWEREQFVLITKLTEDEITHFFLDTYSPSPFVSPWNGSTGFYPKDAQKDLLASILEATPTRFGSYRVAVKTAQKVIVKLKLKEQPKDAQLKKQLLSRLRDEVPDVTAQWIDTCAMITSDEHNPLKFVPLMGTGGNDGNFEFGRSFMQQLQKVMDFKTGEPTTDSPKLLRSALFDTVTPKLPYSGKIGQFSPMAAGGANATAGTDGDSRVNPWDFILMLEGMLVLMPGITRRGESGAESAAAPFTATRPSAAGYGSAADEKVRAELWVPLWTAPVGLGELRVMFREGRAKVNTGGALKYRSAQSGVDFVRAVASLGVARGITEFHRYGFQERNGLSYFAVSLGRFRTPPRPRRDPLRDLDEWLSRFLSVASGETAPAGVKRSARRLENAIVDQAQGKATMLDVLMALGEVEKTLNQSLSFVIDKDNKIKTKPIPYLRSSRWLVEANDGTSEFRLALALARSGLRQRLVRVRGETAYWEKEDDKITTWGFGPIEDNLLTLALRSEIEQERDEKTAARLAESPEEKEDDDDEKLPDKSQSKTQRKTLYLLPNFQDIAAWIQGDLDDDRLEAIARGLSLLKFSRSLKPVAAQDNELPMAYKLLKVVQHRTILDDEGKLLKKLPRVPGLLSKLKGDRLTEALADAARRLRASNLRPRLDALEANRWGDRELDCDRLGAALAFPLTDEQVKQLFNQIKIQD
jgi:CRISPR-associated protein Csx17